VTFGRHANLHGSSTAVDCDRQWTAARGHGEAVTSVRCGRVGYAWRTANAGVSWTGPFIVQSPLLLMGPLAFAPDGSLYVAFQDGTRHLSVARSADGGLTWTSRVVALDYAPVGFPVVAVDAANAVYVAYDNATQVLPLPYAPLRASVLVASSANQGATWTAPTLVSAPGVTSIFPWISAGAASKVDVAWYAENFPANPADAGPPDLGLPTTTWDVVMAQSLAASAAAPAYARATAVAAFHAGSVCTSGLFCVGPQNAGVGNVPTPVDRRVLDFFELRADPATGLALIAYPQDRPTVGTPNDAIFCQVDLRVAIQDGGTTVL
jgi:hypothetical protein